MAIDSAEKRKSLSGVNYFNPGVTPTAGKDQEWRQEAGYSYSGVLSLTPAAILKRPGKGLLMRVYQ